MRPVTADAVVEAFGVLDPGRRWPALQDYSAYISWLVNTRPWWSVGSDGSGWGEILRDHTRFDLGPRLFVIALARATTSVGLPDPVLLCEQPNYAGVHHDAVTIGTMAEALSYAHHFGVRHPTEVAESVGAVSPRDAAFFAVGLASGRRPPPIEERDFVRQVYRETTNTLTRWVSAFLDWQPPGAPEELSPTRRGLQLSTVGSFIREPDFHFSLLAAPLYFWASRPSPHFIDDANSIWKQFPRWWSNDERSMEAVFRSEVDARVRRYVWNDWPGLPEPKEG